jgi:hypothetical protein
MVAMHDRFVAAAHAVHVVVVEMRVIWFLGAQLREQAICWNAY